MPKERKRSRKEPEHEPEPEPEDTDSEEEEPPRKRRARGSWREDLRVYLTEKMSTYLTKNKFTNAEQQLLNGVLDDYIDKLMNGKLKKHTKTAAWKNILEKAKEVEAESENEGEEPWVERLVAQVRTRVMEFLVKNKTTEREKETIKGVADNYLNTLSSGGYAKHDLAKAWKSIKNSAIRVMEEEAAEAAEDEEQEQEEEETPTVGKKRKRGGGKKKTPKGGMEKTPARRKVINAVSRWVRDIGIKPKSKYILQMDILLEDRLKSDDWEATGISPHRVAKDIIQEFKDKFPNFIRKLNRQNFNYYLNPRKKPQWSEATLKKRQDQRKQTSTRSMRK